MIKLNYIFRETIGRPPGTTRATIFKLYCINCIGPKFISELSKPICLGCKKLYYPVGYDYYGSYKKFNCGFSKYKLKLTGIKS